MVVFFGYDLTCGQGDHQIRNGRKDSFIFDPAALLVVADADLSTFFERSNQVSWLIYRYADCLLTYDRRPFRIVDDDKLIDLFQELFLFKDEVPVVDLAVVCLSQYGPLQIFRNQAENASEVEQTAGISQVVHVLFLIFQGFNEVEVLATRQTYFVGRISLGCDDCPSFFLTIRQIFDDK